LPRFLDEASKSTDQITPSALSIAAGEEVILVVEDDEGLRANTAKMLSELGCRVLEVPDGFACLAFHRLSN
jgi:PleD family two-component response regulator